MTPTDFKTVEPGFAPVSAASEMPTDPIARAELIQRYKRLRAVNSPLTNRIILTLSKDVVQTEAKRLGIQWNRQTRFDDLDEAAILMDYCLHNVRRNGRSAIDEFLIKSHPEEGSDELACLRALQQALYSLFVIETIHPGVGVTLRDLVSQKRYFILDFALAATGQERLMLTMRLIFHVGLTFSSGASIPIGLLQPNERHNSLVRDFLKTMTPNMEPIKDPANLIAGFLDGNRSAKMSFPEPADSTFVGRLSAVNAAAQSGSRSTKIGRNAGCPCGSGRKFKDCCKGLK